MKSRVAGPPTVIVNLAAFGACACLAFARNINALFFHYDGSYLLVGARDQLNFGQPVFGYTNNFLQSIGNIQLPQNALAAPLFVADRLVFQPSDSKDCKLLDSGCDHLSDCIWARATFVAISNGCAACGM